MFRVPRFRSFSDHGLASLLALSASLVACERTEPDRSVSVTQQRTDVGSVSAARPSPPRPETASPKTDQPSCLIALPDAPPPAAHRAEACPKDTGQPMDLPRGWVYFVDAPGKPRVAVEIANTPSSRERGLMFRTQMPEEQGMLFSWTEPDRRSFWMHNTCIPLDLIYISEGGVISGVVEQAPTLNDEPRGVPCPTLHVLEVNAGWTRSHGVRPGQRVTIEY